MTKAKCENLVEYHWSEGWSCWTLEHSV